MRAIVAGAVVALLLLAVPAAAHTGGAVMEVRTAETDEERAIDVIVDVTYEGDGEPAAHAFVTVTPRDDTGRRLDPVDLDRADGGRYLSTIRLDQPGRWTLDITSSFPPGETSVAVDIGGTASSRATVIIAAVAVAVFALVGLFAWRARRTRLARASRQPLSASRSSDV